VQFLHVSEIGRIPKDPDQARRTRLACAVGSSTTPWLADHLHASADFRGFARPRTAWAMRGSSRAGRYRQLFALLFQAPRGLDRDIAPRTSRLLLRHGPPSLGDQLSLHRNAITGHEMPALACSILVPGKSGTSEVVETGAYSRNSGGINGWKCAIPSWIRGEGHVTEL
jgi:hypothetical protein